MRDCDAKCLCIMELNAQLAVGPGALYQDWQWQLVTSVA